MGDAVLSKMNLMLLNAGAVLGTGVEHHLVSLYPSSVVLNPRI